MKTTRICLLGLLLVLAYACTPDVPDPVAQELEPDPVPSYPLNPVNDDDETGGGDNPGPSGEVSIYKDNNGDVAYIPAQFRVSDVKDEQTIRTGLVVIGPDGSEYVWVPTAKTELKMREFGSYFGGVGSLSSYRDETTLPAYQAMAKSVATYGGFYIGRYEATYFADDGNRTPVSKRHTSNDGLWMTVQYSPQDATENCAKLYAGNSTVQGFFVWGANWDTTLQWLVDSGCKTYADVASNSTPWGNYSDDSFSPNANGNFTGVWEQARANNIYDLAGNNWEWTQERYGDNYVMRSGGYNLMGGACPGNRYPAAIRDPLPGNDHHPNACIRVGLHLK